MCLIIETKKDIPLSDKLLLEFVNRNDDGFGFMYIKDNKLEVEKHVDKPKELLIERYQALKDYEPMIHLRMKTHGLIDHENTHPYPCGNGIWLMHNGVFSAGNSWDTSKSDTWHFIDRIIKPMFEWGNPHKMIRTPFFQALMERMVGANNRLVFGDRGGFVIINKQAWHTITEPTTEAVGLLVSNTYAWSQNAFIPKKSYGTGNMTNAVKYGILRKSTSEGLTQMDSDLFVDEEGEIWEKSVSGYWRVTAPNKRQRKARKRLQRQQKLLKEQGQADLKGQAELVGIPAPVERTHAPTLLTANSMENVKAPGPCITVYKKEDSDEEAVAIVESQVVDLHKLSEETYLEHLEKEYRSMPKDALNSACYTDPDDAARLLYRILHNE